MQESKPVDIFGDFFTQLPPSLFVVVCGSGFLLFLAFAWFIYFKPKRANNRLQKLDSAPLNMTDTGEMPGLDDLLNIPDPVRDQNGTHKVKMYTGETVTAPELVAILRDPNTGGLIVQINNVGYHTLTPDVKKDFVKIMRELSSVVADEEPKSAPKAQVAAPPPPKPRAIPTDLPAIDNKGTVPGDLPTFDLDKSLTLKEKGGLFSKPKYEAAPLPEVNIAASIEAYLQYKLKHTAEYMGREIHVHSAPGGGVRIQVDESSYESVGDVAETDVREFLASTIQEWQDRQ